MSSDGVPASSRPRKSEAWHVARTMEVLELLALAPMSAPRIAAAMGAHPRTVRRVLERLAEEEWVTFSNDSRRQWAPTMRLTALAGWTLQRSELVRMARPYVLLLHERTGAAAHLVAPAYDSVVCVAHAAGDVHEPPRLRELVPAHATAGGKVLLAHRSRWRESILRSTLERFTDRTIIEAEDLRVHLEAALRGGFAIEAGEYQDDVHAVGVPVFVGDEAVAAVTLSGPGLRSDDVLAEVRNTAARITEELRRG